MIKVFLKFRRIVLGICVFLCIFLSSFLLIIPSPDLSSENDLRQQLIDLKVRVEHAEALNLHRKQNLVSLYQQFMGLMKVIQSTPEKANTSMTEFYSSKFKNILDVESEALFTHANWTYDLSLPSIHQSLPHTINHPNSFIPSFKVSAGRSGVSIVIGVPTVKRDKQSYLLTTLKSLTDSLTEQERSDVLIVIFIAEYEREFIVKTANSVMEQFSQYVQDGIIDIVAPPAEYYPDWGTLKQTFNDDHNRVQWRSKQNLDYAYLMMYCQWRGNFYLQLEDDVLTKPGFLTTIKEFTLEKVASNEEWILIDFCQLGFIGKLFQSSKLHILIQFFLMFYNDKPVDWLLDNVIYTKICGLDTDMKVCNKQKQKYWIRYNPSLFQHIGTISSLKGKIQKLKDKQFGKIALFTAHKNPKVSGIESKIKHYKHYSIARAYHGESYFWGLVPQKGDTIIFNLDPEVPLKSFKFASGNAEHPSDIFLNTDVFVMYKDDSEYIKVGTFNSNGIAEGKIDPLKGPVSKLKLLVDGSFDNWAILSEISLKTSS